MTQTTNPLSMHNLHARIINELPKLFKVMQTQNDEAHAAGNNPQQLFVKIEFLAMVNAEGGVAGMECVAVASDDLLTVAAADLLAPQIEAALNILAAAEMEATQNGQETGSKESGPVPSGDDGDAVLH